MQLSPKFKLIVFICFAVLVFSGCQRPQYQFNDTDDIYNVESTSEIESASSEVESTSSEMESTSSEMESTSVTLPSSSIEVLTTVAPETTAPTKEITSSTPKSTTPTTKSTTPTTTQNSGPIDIGDVNSVRFADVLGDVLFVKGSESQWFKAFPGMQLNLKDTVATEVASEADLDVDADKHVLVGEEVRMVVDTLLKEVGKSKATVLRVDTGVLYVRIQRKLDKDETFEVVTPTSIMGVRGTHFVVEVVGGDTAISVIEGSVEGQMVKRDPIDGPALTPTERKKAQEAMPTFRITANQRATIPFGSQTTKEMIKVTLVPAMLPPTVLEKIQREPDLLPARFKESLSDALATAKEISKINGANLEAQRFKFSGARYVDPITGKVYTRVDLEGTYQDALDWCKLRGGHLMSIDSAKEDIIAKKFVAYGNKTQYLLGRTQKATEEGSLQTHVNLVNREQKTTETQKITELSGTYGFLCEWDSLTQVRTAKELPTDRDAIDSKLGITIMDADGSISVIPEGSRLPTGATIVPGLEPMPLVTELKWETATANLFPFQKDKLTYELFDQQKLGGSIESLLKIIGVGGKLGSSDTITWSYTDGLKQLKVVTLAGKIEEISQKNLAKAETNQDLSLLTVQERLKGLKSLTEAERYLGGKGVVEHREKTATGALQTTYLWTDASGRVVAVLVDEALTIQKVEFRGLK